MPGNERTGGVWTWKCSCGAIGSARNWHSGWTDRKKAIAAAASHRRRYHDPRTALADAEAMVVPE